ncbi:MAG: hypothetical protein Q7T76_08245 [Ferruginibacter sp.]|nr:hypothetical protein [Ferruginibacter sp.]
MKKITMMFVSAVTIASLVTTQTNAQEATDATYAINFTPSKKPGNAGEGKYNLADNQATVKELTANLKSAKINLKVTNYVTRNFSNVSDLRFQTEKNLIIARFNTGAKSSRVVYDDKGNWLYSITNYSAEHLPNNIRSLVNRSYGKYTITMVQEVSQGDVNLHKIHLEDARTIKHILVNNDEITEYADFKKGN